MRAPDGYAAQAGDCDDSDPARSPLLVEPCEDSDGVDQDCDGVTDPECTPASLRLFSGYTFSWGTREDMYMLCERTCEGQLFPVTPDCPGCAFQWRATWVPDAATCDPDVVLLDGLGVDDADQGQVGKDGSWTPAAVARDGTELYVSWEEIVGSEARYYETRYYWYATLQAP